MACCENILYVFGYGSKMLNSTPTWQTEIIILGIRTIFPVHPLCAAIQSIGICRRDLEEDKSYQLGRAILPALLLHGFFDFFAMIIDPLVMVWSNKDFCHDPNEEEVPQTSNFTSSDILQSIFSLCLPALVTLIFVIYYILESKAQRKRLDALELEKGEKVECEALII